MFKRIYLKNQIYFVTTKTFGNQKIFDNQVRCALFIKILAECRERYKFKLYGYVIISDHVHLLIEPADQNNISEIVHSIKGNFAHQYLITRNHKGSTTGRTDRSNHVADPLWVGGKNEENHKSSAVNKDHKKTKSSKSWNAKP